MVFILLILSGCKTADTQIQATQTESYKDLQQRLIVEEKLVSLAAREDALAAREVAISAREKELVNLLSELHKQKSALNSQANQKKTQTISGARRNSSVAHKKSRQNSSTNKDDRVVLGSLEHVYLDPPGMTFGARIDTGAQTSSLNAIDMVELERDGKPYVKFYVINPSNGKKIELVKRIHGHVRIKEHKGKSQRRPIVKLRVMLADIDERINFTLADRRKFKQPILLGRNFLQDLAIVDVSQKYTAPKVNPVTQTSK